MSDVDMAKWEESLHPVETGPVIGESNTYPHSKPEPQPKERSVPLRRRARRVSQIEEIAMRMEEEVDTSNLRRDGPSQPIELDMRKASFPEPSPSGKHWVMPGIVQATGSDGQVRAGRRAGKERRGSVELCAGRGGMERRGSIELSDGRDSTTQLLSVSPPKVGRRGSVTGGEAAFLGNPGNWGGNRLTGRNSPTSMLKTGSGSPQRIGGEAGVTGADGQVRAGRRAGKERRGSVELGVGEDPVGVLGGLADGGGRRVGNRRGSVGRESPVLEGLQPAVPAAGGERRRRRRSVNIMGAVPDNVDDAFAELDFHLRGGP